MTNRILAGALALALPLPVLAGPDSKTVPPGTPVTITVQPAQPASPTVTITLKERHGHATPENSGCTHTGGCNIDVQQPSPDTIVITMTGAAVATGGLKGSTATVNFDLLQCFDLVFEKAEVKAAKITLEGRVIGVLRSGPKGGCASASDGGASITADTTLVSVAVPDHSVSGGENLSINDKGRSANAILTAGAYTLHQTWQVSASHPKALLGKAVSAEFAPDPAIDPLWLSYKEPFHGAAKKDFGFQITIKVAEETVEQKKEEKK